MSTVRSRIHPARRVPQPRQERARARALVPGLVGLVGRRVQLGVGAEVGVAVEDGQLPSLSGYVH